MSLVTVTAIDSVGWSGAAQAALPLAMVRLLSRQRVLPAPFVLSHTTISSTFGTSHRIMSARQY
jgi:hypothetical protein